jgi:uncharacterized protein (TIGR00266 family)
MTLDVQLVGTTTKMAIITLRPGQLVYTEAGKFLFCSDDVVMETKLSAPADPSGAGTGTTPGAGGRAGGMGGFLRTAAAAGKRVLMGESLALNHFRTSGPHGLLGLAGVLPGEMRAIEMDGRTTWYAEKDAFIGAEAGVHMDLHLSAGLTGFMGGEGIFLEKFTGTGTLIIGGSGDFIDINPADYGGRIRVDTGCIVAWDENIRYSVQRAGGIAGAMFGGEGFTLAVLEGNGRVVLQSVAIESLAKALAKNTGAGDNKGLGGLGGVFSGSQD